MHNLDFSSWSTLLSTLLGLSVITLIGVGIRLLAMQVIQQRRERENRQINERLRTLIAAYKTLGGSFTGNLAVDPSHMRELRQRHEQTLADAPNRSAAESSTLTAAATALLSSSERPRRIRDAVEAALSDIILLGTEEQVRLAAKAATELAAGRPTHTAELVTSLRDFIRQVLDLEPISPSLSIPMQGPTRIAASKGKGANGGKGEGGGGGKGGGGSGGGMGGMGIGGSHTDDDETESHH
ncbi:hypothetical protein ELE36_11985 [Pseudolysobacter antarcticus]|uniref:Uncharacterized protein n=1 Tax=Pseudolysobacter antarcticus TaxID=2511995 RepID=A0A411HKE8_9GAMM|nr:hypothetical protein [Pseudolysobacter antarcticus]QBB71009.1 hypothetical protein ELE36_11985 [Pseudolysobacter antarcticus]